MKMQRVVQVERALRSKSNKFLLKPNDAGKSDIWKTFSLVYEQNFTDNETSTEHVRRVGSGLKNVTHDQLWGDLVWPSHQILWILINQFGRKGPKFKM